MSDPPGHRRVEIPPTRELVRVRVPLRPDGQTLIDLVQVRLDRADEHLQELKADVPAVWEGDRARIVSKFNPERTQRELHIFYRRPDPRLRWATIVSDYVHELRAALNNAVYAVALMTAPVLPLDAKVGRVLAFPIADRNSDWEGRGGLRTIQSLPNDVVAFIAATQPCNGGNAILSMLGGLSNMDKHKLPIILDGVLTQIDLAVLFNARVGRILNVRALVGPNISGAPLVTLTYEESQPAESEMQFPIAYNIFTLHGREWVPVPDAMQVMGREVARIIELLKPYIAGPTPGAHRAPSG